MSEVRIAAVNSRTKLAVWAVWTLMLGIAGWFVVQYGSPIFFGDDWAIAPVLTGEQPVSASWLWSQHNEHRIPIPRLILLGLYAVSNNDLRAPMFFNLVLLAALSVAMILRAATLRGRLHLTDAIFPLILLHLGQAENLIWSWQVGFVVPSVLVGILLLIVVSGTSFRGRPRHGLVAGVCLLMLPLCGANGLLWAFPLSVWACIATVPLLRSPQEDERSAGVAVAMLLLLTAVVSVLYLVGYQQPSSHPPPPHLIGLIKTSLVFLSTLFGMVASFGIVALASSTLGALFLLLLGAGPAMALLKRSWYTEEVIGRHEWIRAAGIVLLLSGPLLLAATVGWGRAGLGTSFGFASRYTTLVAPAFCCVYLVWILYGSQATRQKVQMALFAFAALLVPIHFAQGTDWAHDRRSKLASFERDLRRGLPGDILAERHADALGGVAPAELEGHLRAMEAAGIGEFRRLRTDGITRRHAR
jgi:hypothetical protein